MNIRSSLVCRKEGVQPLDDFRLADVNVAEAALDFNGTLDLMEAIGLP